MDQGNSGGPVTDGEGRVIGVAVSGVRGTTIKFAVPGDAVLRFFNASAEEIWPAAHQDTLGEITEQVLSSLQVLAVPLPGESTKPEQSWKAQRLLEIGPLGLALPVRATFKYTYLGLRRRSGKTEAVLDLNGRLAGQGRNAARVGGSVRGMLLISPETGEVVEGNANIQVDMDLLVDRKVVRANGSLGVRIQRAALVARK
jgi:hypothetical protein